MSGPHRKGRLAFGPKGASGVWDGLEIRGELAPIDLDGIEMRWASQWNESDDGEVRAWRDDVAALIDEVRHLRAVSNRYFEEMVRRTPGSDTGSRPDSGIDHALHYDPSCEECVYLARPVMLPRPDSGIDDHEHDHDCQSGNGKTHRHEYRHTHPVEHLHRHEHPTDEQVARRIALSTPRTETSE